MFSTIVILLVSLTGAFIIIPPLYSKRETKTITVFVFLLSIGTALNIAIGLKKNIPSPLNFIIFIFTPIRKFLLSLFQ